MSSEIIQNVANDNYDDFQWVNFMFSQNFISLFWGLFNDETDLRVRYQWQKNLLTYKCDNTTGESLCYKVNEFLILELGMIGS